MDFCVSFCVVLFFLSSILCFLDLGCILLRTLEQLHISKEDPWDLAKNAHMYKRLNLNMFGG